MGRRFRTNRDLTLPKQYRWVEGVQGEKIGGGGYIEKGTEVGEADLEGVYVDALVRGGFLTELDREPIHCPACGEDPDATKKAKGAKYESLPDLQEHYREAHPALAPPEEV